MEGIFVILWKGDIAKIENIEGDIAKRMVVSFQKKKKNYYHRISLAPPPWG
jgi:hypothetical protein